MSLNMSRIRPYAIIATICVFAVAAYFAFRVQEIGFAPVGEEQVETAAVEPSAAPEVAEPELETSEPEVAVPSVVVPEVVKPPKKMPTPPTAMDTRERR